MWGLPDAEVSERACVHDGDDACVYELRWQERVGWTFTLGGMGLGVLWMLGAVLTSLPVSTCVLASACGLLAGLLVDHALQLREVRRFAREQQRSVGELLGSLEAQFLDLSREMERRQAAEREQRVLLEQLHQAQKMETVGLLAGGIAHDFNNLLTVINTYAGFVLEDMEPGAPARVDLEEVLAAGERATALTSQLLAFSRKQVLEPRHLDLNAVLSDLDRMMRRLIGEDIELVHELQPELWGVWADRGQLEQVIMNLAVNARDAMPQGGRLTLRSSTIGIEAGDPLLSARDIEPGEYVTLEVIDTGVGMAAEVAERVFEPFFTTKHRGQGSGLGLAMVYGILEQSGGCVLLDSEPGHGSTFRLLLPRADAVEPAPSASTDAPVTGGSATVLLVEDERAVRAIAKRILEGAGYRVHTAAQAHQALELWELHGRSIDLLITDVIMPRMSGKDLADRLSAERPALRVLYISGYTDDAIARHGVLEDGVSLLHKPFGRRALCERVAQLLGD